MFFLEDGTGRGFKARVTSDNRLEVSSVADSIQHHISVTDGQAYQVIGTATLSAATVVCLHAKNTSATRNMVITYIRHQIIDESGGATFPDTGNYFRVALGRTRTSGGSEVIPVNLNQGSGNTAEITTYASGPTLTGTAMEIDRWYTKAAGDMNTFSKEGSIIVQPNRTIELSYVGDQTGGTIYSRMSFLMRRPEEA